MKRGKGEYGISNRIEPINMIFILTSEKDYFKHCSSHLEKRLTVAFPPPKQKRYTDGIMLH